MLLLLGPPPVLDVNQQQLDLRRVNSWLLKLNQVRRTGKAGGLGGAAGRVGTGEADGSGGSGAVANQA